MSFRDSPGITIGHAIQIQQKGFVTASDALWPAPTRRPIAWPSPHSWTTRAQGDRPPRGGGQAPSKPGRSGAAITCAWKRRRQPGVGKPRVAAVRGWQIPSVQTFMRRLRAEESPGQIVRDREGRIAAAATYPHQVRSVADLHPLDWCSGDGYRHNVFVRFPSGTVGRPISWYWQDVRTRRMLAYRAGETESAELVRLALHDLVVTAGVPGGIVVDNTHAASARWLASGGKRGKRIRSDDESIPGILDLLGVRVTHSGIERTAGGKARGRGQSKPVERAFRDLGEQIDKHPLAAGAYTGASPLAKPENHGGRILDWEEFLAVQTDGVQCYNARPGRRMEAAHGRSCDEVWAEEIATTPIRRLTRAQEALLLLAVESTVVKRDGSFHLAAGKGAGLPPNRYADEALIAHARRRVVVRFDPQHLHESVEVYDPGGRWLCTAACLLPVGFADTAAAREQARARRTYQRALDQATRARDRIDDLLAAEGVSAPALSSWAGGKYTGDNARLDRLVRRWLDTEAEVAALRSAGLDRHADLAVTAEIESVAARAKAGADVGLIYGAAGSGKTWALRRYADEHAETWYLAMSPAVTTPAATLARLARALDVGAGVTTAARLERAVIEHLRGRHALLIVDEAHQLPAKLLDVIRCVHDQARCGLVLAGNDPLWARLASGERAAQLVSRIGLRRRLTRPADTDILTLAETLLRMRPAGDARRAVLQAGRGIGGLRAVRKLVGQALVAARAEGRERIAAADVVVVAAMEAA